MIPMSEERKVSASEKMKSRWEKAARYADILGKPKDEVFANLDMIDRYAAESEADVPRFIELVLTHGVWRSERQRERKAQREAEKREPIPNSVSIPITSPFPKTKTPEPKEEREKGPMDDLKLMLWTIQKIGTVKKAEKIFQAAKIAIEAMEG